MYVFIVAFTIHFSALSQFIPTRPILLETYHSQQKQPQKLEDLRYEKGEKFNYYLSQNVDSFNYGQNFSSTQCGKIILNIPFVANVNYSLAFRVRNLLEHHVLCVGIGSEGYLTSELLKIEYEDIECISHFQLGYCSDGTNSTKYPQMYANYDEFEDIPYDEQFVDEIVYSYGEPEFENIFESDHIEMNLQGNSLIFKDIENKEILKEFHKLDRDRTYFPIFILKDKNQEFIGNAKMKKNKKRIQRELEKSYKCVKPEDITQRAHQQEVKKDILHNLDEEQMEEEDLFLNEGLEIPASFLQTSFNPFQGRVEAEEKEPTPEASIPDEENEEQRSQIEILDIESHALLSQEEYTAYTKEIVVLRKSMGKTQENYYTIYQQNAQLPFLLQGYESCSYAYLNIQPFNLSSNSFLQVSIIQLDFTHNVYPVGVGVFAASQIDRLKGWQNAQSQIWCMEQQSAILWQYGSIFRTDGTFIDSMYFGEYNIYKSNKNVNRQSQITMYFTKGNRVVYQLGKDKELIVTCVNPKFKYFLPIFELKAWRGKPMIRLDSFESNKPLPFEFSDSESNLKKAFYKVQFTLLNKFFTEKRGSFNDDDDDFIISGSLTDLSETASMNMWDTNLFDKQYEWYAEIKNVNNQHGTSTQICIGVHQMSQENLIESVLNLQYVAQVAYICDKKEFMHTFYQECPIYENPIIFVDGTILRFRLSNYILEISDGYKTLFLSLRKAGNTAVIPSVVIRNSDKNRVQFHKTKPSLGPNPYEVLAEDPDYSTNFQNFVTYNIFSLPKFQEEEQKIHYTDGNTKYCDDEPEDEDESQMVGEDKQLGEQNEEKVAQNKGQDQENDKQMIQLNQERVLTNQKSIQSYNIPIEISIQQLKNNQFEQCIQVFDQCHYQGQSNKICKNTNLLSLNLNKIQSAKIINSDYNVVFTIKKEAGQIENLLMNQDFECLIQPIYLVDMKINFKIK